MIIKSLRDMPRICRRNREREAQVAALGSTITGAELLATKFPEYVGITKGGKIAIDTGGRGFYDFDGRTIKTPAHLLDWIRHLTGKRWMTGLHVHELIEVVCEAKGWTLPEA
jgi:hypothetical protein